MVAHPERRATRETIAKTFFMWFFSLPEIIKDIKEFGQSFFYYS
jgi:hypothetical protein